ncbi:hypothetical protein B0H14DRAFT_2930101 [Mycena olivaceomarginata]|nr:hypothetical protein B0H14DRAFT_2930101 [Mycena olivaceomarginata]
MLAVGDLRGGAPRSSPLLRRTPCSPSRIRASVYPSCLSSTPRPSIPAPVYPPCRFHPLFRARYIHTNSSSIIFPSCTLSFHHLFLSFPSFHPTRFACCLLLILPTALLLPLLSSSRLSTLPLFRAYPTPLSARSLLRPLNSIDPSFRSPIHHRSHLFPLLSRCRIGPREHELAGGFA